jgi:hypothetical protein
LSLVRSGNFASATSTLTWNKFGEEIRKQERRIAGIYIMSNSGKVEPIQELRFQKLLVTEGNAYSRIVISSSVSTFIIKIDHKEPSVLNL